MSLNLIDRPTPSHKVDILASSLASAAMGAHTESSIYLKYLLGSESALKTIKERHQLTTNVAILLDSPTGIHFLYSDIVDAGGRVDVVVENRSSSLGYTEDEMLSKFSNDLTYVYDCHETITLANKLLVGICSLLDYLHNRKTVLKNYPEIWDKQAVKLFASKFHELDQMLVNETTAGLLAEIATTVDQLDVVLKKPNLAVDPWLSSNVATAALLFTLCVNQAKKAYDIESLHDFSKDPEKPLQMRVISQRIKDWHAFLSIVANG